MNSRVAKHSHSVQKIATLSRQGSQACKLLERLANASAVGEPEESCLGSTIATVKPTDLFAATGLEHSDTVARDVERELLAIIDEAAA